MPQGSWRYVKAAFNVRPLGMFLAPNWIGLAAFAVLGLRDPLFLVLGAVLELAYLSALVQSPRFRRRVDKDEPPRAPPGWDPGALQPQQQRFDEDESPPTSSGSELDLPLPEPPRIEEPRPDPPRIEPPRTTPELPPTRAPLIGILTSPAPLGARQLRALAELLGMKDAASASVVALPHGLSLLAARLPYPAPLQGHPVSIVAIDDSETSTAEPARVRAALQSALTDAGQRFELPFLLLSRGDIAQDLLPADLGSLRLGQRELHMLLYSRDPERTLAGLLHARRLLLLSPYSTDGEVKDEQMFFGRVALLKELVLARSIQRILVGPRRAGKTSLLKRLLRELPARRPEVEPVFLDLVGITDPVRAAYRLASTLKVEVPVSMKPGGAFVEILRARFEGTSPSSAMGSRSQSSAQPAKEGTRRGLVVLDEADGLIMADAARGFPLLSAIRALQAKGFCSFILVGYVHLYREARNPHSPLYNFAPMSVLEPLEPEAARDLALVPMQRLGVTYADPALPARIAVRAGCYPSFVQTLCNAALKVLREVGSSDLLLSEEHVARAEAHVATELRDVFYSNTERAARLIAYQLVERDSMSTAEFKEALSRALQRTLPDNAFERTRQEIRLLDAVDKALEELRLFGFAVEAEGRIRWTIPLLRDALRAGDPERMTAELLARDRELHGKQRPRA